MPFRRSSRIGNIVQSIKHVVDAEGALTGALTSFTPISESVVTRTTPFKPSEITIGETINGFFLSIFMIGATGAGPIGSLNWYIAKLRGGQNTGDLPAPGSTGVSTLRNQIFHEEKGLSGSADGTPMAFKGVIAVPKAMRRQREGDQFVIGLRSLDATVDVQFCIKAIYKSFS